MGMMLSAIHQLIDLVILFIVLSIPIFLFSLSAYRLAIDFALHKEGIITDSQVIDHFRRLGKATAFFIRYQFHTEDGRKIVAECGVGKGTYDRLQLNLPIKIKYLPKHPYLTGLTGNNEDRFVHNTAILVGIMFFFFFLFFFPTLTIIWPIVFVAIFSILGLTQIAFG